MIPVKIGRPQQHEGLMLFPLFPATVASQQGWTLLPDALEAETLDVTEVGDGVVGELRVANRGSEPVLILDGEQLIGAKRTTNRTIFVAAGTETSIPVSCMEQGRWRHQGRFMKHGGDYSPERPDPLPRIRRVPVVTPPSAVLSVRATLFPPDAGRILPPVPLPAR